MGMAASQARYLEITARKTNVEYQGQQINQQRTALANESAGLFSQLMGLQVPTAPSSTDYTKVIYTFNDGANNCTISDITTQTGSPEYNATVTYSYDTTTYTGIAKTRTDLGTKNEGTTSSPVYWLTNGASGGKATNQTLLTQCTSNTTDSTYATNSQAIKQICKDNPTSTFASDVKYNSSTGDIGDITKAYYYTSNGTTYYYCNDDLSAMPEDGSASSLTAYYASNLSTKETQTEDAYVTKESSGRYSTIKLASETTTFDVNATSTTDQNAYNDAINEYEYQQSRYQQQVNNINAKTSIIQQEDKTLELQLKQLDTEQEALQTEMDAVKKVIDKNIEQTFKTFSS